MKPLLLAKFEQCLEPEEVLREYDLRKGVNMRSMFLRYSSSYFFVFWFWF